MLSTPNNTSVTGVVEPVSFSANVEGWPLKLMHTQGLKRDRGQVLRIGSDLYAIVGFDGRNEGYICWLADSLGDFDTSDTQIIDVHRAHMASRDEGAEAKVPPLPPLDHRGRLLAHRQRLTSTASMTKPSLDTLSPFATVDPNSKTTSQRTCLGVDFNGNDTTPSAASGGTTFLAQVAPSGLPLVGTLLPGDVPSDSEKDCVLCLAVDGVASIVMMGASRIAHILRPFGLAVLSFARRSECANATMPQIQTSGTTAGELDSLRYRGLAIRKDAFEDMRITIPIVKPPSWEEVQPLVYRMPVTFDERGTKETMTVKFSNWGPFVDRQKKKLVKELRHRQNFASSSSDPVYLSGEEEDVADLQRMIDSMEDWKDLSRYSGKSISMASTRRGNEMKIHIMAFAEREDGNGIDFMRLSYKKSVEVRRHVVAVASEPTCGSPSSTLSQRPFTQVVRSWWQCLAPPDKSAEQEEGWIQLLQRPDVAKFTIALAFRDALEEDGVRLQFCEARLEDD